ncbi:hypothetical protein DFH08DRAFT_945469 [Mycena albidolilacea]|uniref:Uncharacterized protein n=1 Tax=Mycena albidolilacea TaxID=1033008 RepID=A0AAD6Z0N5_9AGAR|nr:hypothetical protein DFH08DRAFT_945469 [Mycena albidolilacea]
MAAVARVLEREKGGARNGCGRRGHCAWRWRCELYPIRDSVESSGWASTASAIDVGTASGRRAVCRMQHEYVVESIWAVLSHLNGRGGVGCVARAKKRLKGRQSPCRRNVQRWGRWARCTDCGDKKRCRGRATGASAEGGGGTLLAGVVITEFQDGSAGRVRGGEGGGTSVSGAKGTGRERGVHKEGECEGERAERKEACGTEPQKAAATAPALAVREYAHRR